MPNGFTECCSFLPSSPVKAGHRPFAVVCQTLFSISDTTNSQAETHFKDSGRDISELLRVNIPNWLTCPLSAPQIRGLRQVQFFTIK